MRKRRALHHWVHRFNYVFPLPRGRWFLQRFATRYSELPALLEAVRIDHGMRMDLESREWVDRCVYFNVHEPEVKYAIDEYVEEGSTALDIGAHAGYFSLLMAHRVGPGGAVHSFEPNAVLSERLRKHAITNGFSDVIHVHEQAVSSSSGPVQLFLYDGYSELSSVAPRWGAVSPSIDVQAVTLDELYAKGVICRPTFLKVDVEGAELLVLKGSEHLIQDARPVIVAEVNQTQQACFDYRPSDLCHWSVARGYRAGYLHPRSGFQELSPETADSLAWENILLVPRLRSRRAELVGE